MKLHKKKLSEDESKIGSAGLVIAIVCGALMPKLQGMIIYIDDYGINDVKIFGISEINLSFLLPVLCFAFITIYGRNNHN